MTNKELHPLVNKIWGIDELDSFCYKTGFPSGLIKEKLNTIIVEWLEEKTDEFKHAPTWGMRDATIAIIKKMFHLPNDPKKDLEKQIAEVIAKKEYPKSYEEHLGPYNLDTAKRIIAFLREKGLLKEGE